MSDFITKEELLSAQQAAERIVNSIKSTQSTQNTNTNIDMSRSHTFRDVHYYDGKIEVPFIPSHNFSCEEKTVLFQKLVSHFKHPIAINMVALINSGMSNYSNIDNINKIDSSDLLAEICMIDLDEEMLFFLQEQLVDNYQLGRCPQGKSWRLLQFYRAAVNAEKEKSMQKKLDCDRKELDELLKQIGNEQLRQRAIAYFLKYDDPQRQDLKNALIELLRYGSVDSLNKLGL